ncbi:hypothetical protein PanWU01x14_022290 [Parasponia andersonii]|uniref:Uncharacterized protein n=1 Tax=Parasponia andersonii TaxID=3476 RepID=A0A2P5DX59_PARAD|nr:hypothetical protein PanWU01x14_022290 [Parasponia andersonii]
MHEMYLKIFTRIRKKNLLGRKEKLDFFNSGTKEDGNVCVEQEILQVLVICVKEGMSEVDRRGLSIFEIKWWSWVEKWSILERKELVKPSKLKRKHRFWSSDQNR